MSGLTDMTPPDVDRCVAELERMRERQADYLLMAQGTAESEPIRERIEALDAAIRALRQGGGWPSPPDNCRMRLQAEGKPHPRSGCAACGELAPEWRDCLTLIEAEAVAARRAAAAPPSPAKEG